MPGDLNSNGWWILFGMMDEVLVLFLGTRKIEGQEKIDF